MSRLSEWDKLSNHFNVYLPDVDKGVAANLDQTWITLEPFVSELAPQASVLDYGCGSGALCNKLDSLGFKVCGTDISPEMIKIARENSPSSVSYWTTEEKSLDELGKFSLIASSMVFQFVADLHSLVLQLKNHLHLNGILWFSVHNEFYIMHPASRQFKDHSEKNGERKATLLLKDISIPISIRSAKDYEDICTSCGLVKALEWHSEPSEEGIPSKYLVQGYRLCES